MMMSDMETAGGYCNLTYLESRHTSTTSIPGRYRRTEEPGCGDVVDVATIHIKYPKKTKNFEPSSMILNGKHLDQNANNIKLPDLTSTISTISHSISNGSHNEKKTIEEEKKGGGGGGGGGGVGVESGDGTKVPRENWNNGLEFLMSCIALSVGLGNVWRFPFTALENGGGAFVVPYLLVLFLVGKPVYYMEMLLGQFSSRGCIQVYDIVPLLRGVGYGQLLATGIVTTYYATLMAVTLRYFIDSFSEVLPWSFCRLEWGGETCIASSYSNLEQSSLLIGNNTSSLRANITKTTSAEFYFNNIILHEKDTIDDGIGTPNLSLALTLALAWILIAIIIIKGVRSSGKVSYVLALFPYCIMFILLIRALTLPGSMNGVLYFLKPQWNKLLDPKVWYAAVTQVFFSLAICFGNIIMYSSYNRFNHNIKKDCTIIATLDTCTSLLSGIITFGILGNLAYESNTDDIQSVVKGGPGLAFISYPDAVAKFQRAPQVFSVLFFLMLFTLGVGSNVGMASCIITSLKDYFTRTKQWIIVVLVAVTCYLLGLLYVTPGGQFLLNLLDFYGVSFVALVLAIFELLAVGWIYGVKRFCRDIHFMLGIKTSIYYRICWAVITPLLMICILIYMLIDYKPLQYKDYTYPDALYIFGWSLSAFGIGQLIIWAIREIYVKYKENRGKISIWEAIQLSLQPSSNWGPVDEKLMNAYKYYTNDWKMDGMFRRSGFWHRIHDNICG